MRRVAALAIALLLVAAPLARAQAPKLTILGDETLKVKAKQGKDTADTHLSVLNPSDVPTQIRVTFQASSSDKVRIDNYTGTADPGATRVKVSFGGLEKLEGDPVSGQVVVTGGAEPVAQAASITPAPQPSLNWSFWLFIGAGIAALALVVLVLGVAALSGTLPKLGGPAPGPKWSFDSWATNLTAAGAVFGTAVGAVTLPEVPREIDKDTLVQMNLLFGVMLVVGPFLAQAIRRPSATNDEIEAGLWGYSPVLLLAYSITGAAVMGEVAALALLGWELTEGGVWGWLCVLGAAVTVLLAAYYFVVTTYEQVSTDWKRKAEDAAAAAKKPTRVVVVQGDGLEALTFEALGGSLRQMAPMP